MRVKPKQGSLGLGLWPQKPADFRPAMERYVEAATKCCNRLLKFLAEAFGLERRSFTKQFEPRSECVANVRVNYYPPWPGSEEAAPNGISPHSDGSAVTVLAQLDGTEGLEVLRPRGWVRLPAPREALLVAAGDLLEVMSGGKLKSPWHRAAARGNRERFSVPVFYYSPEDAVVEPVVGGAGPTITEYKKVVVREYVRNYYKVSPTLEKIAIDFAKA